VAGNHLGVGLCDEETFLTILAIVTSSVKLP